MKMTRLFLKGQGHKIFFVLHQKTTSPGPNRHAQKQVQIFSNIRGVIRSRN
jgi:hypothetical protein